MAKFKAKIDGRRMSTIQIINELWKSRGIKNSVDFLYPDSSSMVPFSKFKNIDAAAETFIKACNQNKRIFIYADVDQDGISSGTIIYKYIKKYQETFNKSSNEPYLYINEGKAHGIQADFNYKMLRDFDLVIIVDAIQDSCDAYKLMKREGVDLIVLDHHMIPPEVLEMQEEINLVSSANDYPNPALSGAGVCLKFCLYVDSLLGTEIANDFYDLATTGIVADMCSLGQEAMENRYICSRGFANPTNLGIKTVNGSYEFDSTAVSFGIAPLVNNANRIGENSLALRLFCEDNITKVKEVYKQLGVFKAKIADKMSSLFNELLEQEIEQKSKKCLIFFSENCGDFSGVLANKALGKWGKPCMILHHENGMIKGSYRAVGVDDFSKYINDTNIGKAFGHELAGGVRVPDYRFDEFCKKLEESLGDLKPVDSQVADIQLSQRQITPELIRKLKEINKISGKGFVPVTVMVDDITDYTIGSMKDGKHLRITTPFLSLIKWNFEDWDSVKENKSLSVMGTVDQSFFGRQFTRQIIMDDFGFEDKIELF